MHYIVPVNNGVLDIDYLTMIKGITIAENMAVVQVKEGTVPKETWEAIGEAEFFSHLRDVTPKPSLDNIKQAKIAELDDYCSKTILAGFKSSVNGEEHHYGFDHDDQTNFTQKYIELLLNPGLEIVLWKPKSSIVPLEYTREQFLSLLNDIKQHKEGNIAKFWGLKMQVLSAESEEDVQAITW